MRYGSLCSGIGGLDLAVETVWPGSSPAWFCEADPHAARVLERWWPGVPVLPDLKTQDWSTVERVELITAGYPCQPFSFAGKRQGSDDPRHLWPFVLAAVRSLRPRVVVLENVAGHLRLGFDAVLGDLAEAGFDAEWSVVPASVAGACHRRERLFVLARHPERQPAHALAAAGGSRDSARQPDSKPASDADSGRLQERGEPDGGTSTGQQAPRRRDADRRGTAVPDAEGVGCEWGGATWRRGPRPADDRDAAPDADEPGSQGPQPEGRRDLPAWGDYAAAIGRWERIIGRPAPRPTDEKGRLSVSFVEWMQGFDEGWVDGLSRTAALRCLGNAVVQQQAVLALHHIGGQEPNDMGMGGTDG